MFPECVCVCNSDSPSLFRNDFIYSVCIAIFAISEKSLHLDTNASVPIADCMCVYALYDDDLPMAI